MSWKRLAALPFAAFWGAIIGGYVFHKPKLIAWALGTVAVAFLAWIVYMSVAEGVTDAHGRLHIGRHLKVVVLTAIGLVVFVGFPVVVHGLGIDILASAVDGVLAVVTVIGLIGYGAYRLFTRSR